MPKPPDYEKRERLMWRKNAEDVSKRLDEGDEYLSKRIRLFVSRFGYDVEVVQEKIRTDRMFAAHFAKEPRRQNIHESAAGEWLRAQKDVVQSFEKLPTSGKNAFYITGDGELRQDGRTRPSKSLDFRWKSNGFTVFAAHKYTKEGGGTQDNAFREVRSLIEHFQKGAADDDIILLVIVDGPYYTKARMSDLKRFERENHPPYSRALPIQAVPDFLKEVGA